MNVAFDVLLAEERRHCVRVVISQLEPIQAQVVILGSSGYSSKEIAALLGSGSIRSTCFDHPRQSPVRKEVSAAFLGERTN